VIGDQVGADHPVRHVLDAGALDPTRGAITARVGIEQQSHHHRRLVRRPAMAVGAIVRIERAQIHLRDRVQHRPDKVTVRHPAKQRRAHQKCLLTTTLDEVLGHAGSLLDPPDGIPLPDSHVEEQHCQSALLVVVQRSNGLVFAAAGEGRCTSS
jgi:hypothetical protein